MSGPALGTLWRTFRHLRARQAVAQMRHLIAPGGRPIRLGGAPPRLAAARATAAFPGRPPHARLEVDGDDIVALTLVRGRVAMTGRIDWDADESPLWRYHLHQHDFLRASELTPSMRTRVLLDWIERHPEGVGWDPHPTSLRIVTWGRLLLTPGALALEPDAIAQVRRSLADQAETLSRSLEVRLQANHLLSNLLGVVFAGLLLEGDHADRWLGHETALHRELADQIGRDGLHVERSPMYHALLLENVMDLLNLARSVPERTPQALQRMLEDCATRMLAALQVVTHPDGRIALFADSAFEVAHEPSEITAYAGRLGLHAPGPLERDALLEDAGYVRLEGERSCLIASVAGPAPAHMPGHAHCDSLAFELSMDGQRFVTDTGVCEYVPGARRDAARTVRSHSTWQIGGHEPAELWSAFRIGGRPRVLLERFEPGRAEAWCEGFATRRTRHHRIFARVDDGIEIRDRLTGRTQPVRFPLPLAPHVVPSLEASSRARLALPGGPALSVSLPEAFAWRLDRAPYFPEFGGPLERPCLVGESAGPTEATLRIVRG